ncbi:serine hydrolase domain-containing protein [Oceanirhabdus sp. W0125-5]|uniref:serine hydrolase domain-containing protein n=1 Tax=Oceanirhabdus sp. W0125-5 TaxID=2999116 RepID=UPI0022F2D9D7|nr:serine hydrolase [Oceanirhabdus sp. W0125-5]WBW94976.1 serine hydrolase [Oceanirhabdus sp. W0125-5]
MTNYYYKENDNFSELQLKGFIKDAFDDKNINIKTFSILNKDCVLSKFSISPYTFDENNLMFSLTKSITSLGIGIAVDKGYLELDSKVVDFFSDKLPKTVSENLSLMTVEDLLTMSSGIHENTYADLFYKEDWVEAFLAQDFPHTPGTYYRYSTHGSHMLSAIIEKATGQKLDDFMDKYFFTKMDIPKPQWEYCLQGITCGGMGLSMSANSLRKIGFLLLNEGVYQGEQVISKEYLEKATCKKIFKVTEKDPETKIYSGIHYGYQLHINKFNHYRMDGGFGQICLIMPEKELAFIVTSQNSKIEPLMECIYKHFYFTPSASYEDRSLPKLSYNYDQYSNKIESLESLGNMSIKLEKNPLNIDNVFIKSHKEKLNIELRVKDSSIKLDFSADGPYKGKSYFIKDVMWHNQNYLSYMNWDNGTLDLLVVYLETPYVVNYIFKFSDDCVIMDFKINKSLTLNDFTAKGKVCNSL